MKRGAWAMVIALTITGARAAGQTHDHGNGKPAITYAELQRTSELLATARKATAKYQNVRLAEADGYRAIGPYVPGKKANAVKLRHEISELDSPATVVRSMEQLLSVRSA